MRTTSKESMSWICLGAKRTQMSSPNWDSRRREDEGAAGRTGLTRAEVGGPQRAQGRVCVFWPLRRRCRHRDGLLHDCWTLRGFASHFERKRSVKIRVTNAFAPLLPRAQRSHTASALRSTPALRLCHARRKNTASPHRFPASFALLPRPRPARRRPRFARDGERSCADPIRSALTANLSQR